MIGPVVDTMSAPSRTTFGVRVPKYMYDDPSSSVKIIGSMGSSPVLASRALSTSALPRASVNGPVGDDETATPILVRSTGR